MTAEEIAGQLIELEKTWDGAGALLAVRDTSPIFEVVMTSTLIGKTDERLAKSLNALADELSGLMSDDYLPIAVIAWKEYAPQQANIRTEFYPEFSEDSWAKDILDNCLKGMKDYFEKRNIKFDRAQ